METTISATLKDIAESLEPLNSFNQEWWFHVLPEFITSFFAVATALVVAYLMEPWIRSIRKSNLKAIRVIPVFQDYQYIYRLVFVNDSNYVAKNVEVDIEEVYDDGDNKRESFIPSPLRWTHGSEKPRDIFPRQPAYLDICEIKQEQGKFIRLAAPNIADLREMPYIKNGVTKLILRYYQENGQIGTIKISINWNGQESFETGLPEMRLANRR